MRKLLIILLVVLIMPIQSNWLATAVSRQKRETVTDLGRLRRIRRFDKNNLEANINKLLGNIRPEARSAISESLGLTGAMVEDSQRTGGGSTGSGSVGSVTNATKVVSAALSGNENYAIIGGNVVGSGKAPGGGTASPSITPIPAGGSPGSRPSIGNIQPQPE